MKRKWINLKTIVNQTKTLPIKTENVFSFFQRKWIRFILLLKCFKN